MDPLRVFRPLSWIRFALVSLILIAVAVFGFVSEHPVIGWIALGIFVFLAGLRVTTVVLIRRARAIAAANPRPPIGPTERERRIRVYVAVYAATLGAFVIAAAVGGALLLGEFAMASWLVAGVLTLCVILILAAAAIARKRRQQSDAQS